MNKSNDMTGKTEYQAFEKWRDNYPMGKKITKELYERTKDSWQAAIQYTQSRINELNTEISMERERSKILVEAVKKCNDDHWFMINLIERYSNDKDQALKDCLERMKFRKPLYEKAIEDYANSDKQGDEE